MNELSRMEVRADDIIQYGYIAVKQFPKSEKFVLATRITDLMWEMAALISSAIDAQYSQMAGHRRCHCNHRSDCTNDHGRMIWIGKWLQQSLLHWCWS